MEIKKEKKFEKLSLYCEAVENNEGPIITLVTDNLRSKLFETTDCVGATKEIVLFNKNLKMMVKSIEFVLGKKIVINPLTEI